MLQMLEFETSYACCCQLTISDRKVETVHAGRTHTFCLACVNSSAWVL